MLFSALQEFFSAKNSTAFFDTIDGLLDPIVRVYRSLVEILELETLDFIGSYLISAALMLFNDKASMFFNSLLELFK